MFIFTLNKASLYLNSFLIINKDCITFNDYNPPIF